MGDKVMTRVPIVEAKCLHVCVFAFFCPNMREEPFEINIGDERIKLLESMEGNDIM